MTRVAVVNFGLSNIDSVCRVLEELGAKPTVVDEPGALADADRIVVPGVGSFGDAIQNLRSSGLADALTETVERGGVPLLGICLGMQLLVTTGEEGGTHRGLGVIDGSVGRLEPVDGERVPHVGWNEVHTVSDHPLFAGIPPDADFYFVHSYHVRCDASAVVATTPYCGEFVSVVESGPVLGVQFHPEKSQEHGQRLLANFLSL